jgi:hypothetical protein
MSLLPQLIPPQTEPFGEVQIDPQSGKPTGNIIIGVNWYLFLYNIGKQTLSGSGTPIPVPPSVFLSIPEDDTVPPNPVTPNTLIWLDPV